MKAAAKMSTRNNPKVVSREEWLVARKKLLAREKQLTGERDAVAAERRLLPWVKVEKNYVFDSPSGKKTLADLFNGKSQLIVYHLMFGPEWSGSLPQLLLQHGSYGPSSGAPRDSATSPSPQFPGRTSPRSKHLRSAWDGSSTGSLATELTSTTTTRRPSRRSKSPKAGPTATQRSFNS